MLPFLELNYDAVQHVNACFIAGEIIDNDTRKFEVGLIYVGHLPALQIQRSAYNEMVASGMFARLHSEQLKREIAELYATRDWVEKNFSWWRNSVETLQTAMDSRVTWYSEDNAYQAAYALNEPVRRVKFDFTELYADVTIRNGFYWATDTHSDWVQWTRQLTEQSERAVTLLDEELANR
jgi:hypothetical protein